MESKTVCDALSIKPILIEIRFLMVEMQLGTFLFVHHNELIDNIVPATGLVFFNWI